jgi:hypothetical protein
MDGWREEIESRLLVTAGDAKVLAKGRLYEQEALGDEIHITGPGSSVFVTGDEILWSGLRGDVRRLPFEGVTGYSEAEQYHRYALLLEHGEAEFIERVPARRVLWWKWGNKREPRSRIETCLGFSRRDTDVAAAIRSELARRNIGPGLPIQMPQPTRAERTAESEAMLLPSRSEHFLKRTD